jgi:dTDP-4-dehydrorhamnose reductase
MLGSNIVASVDHKSLPLDLQSSGQAADYKSALSKKFELYPTYLRNRIACPRALQLDISDRDSVLKSVEAIQPEVIVHAGGMTKPTACEKEPAVAHRVNVEGTAHLVEAAKDIGARFIFLSSDLVFDGNAERYDEDSPTHPLSIYGQTKVEGEELVRTGSKDFFIVRTTVMYGWSSRYTESMAEWILRGLQAGRELNMYHDQYRQFIFINDLVATILELIEIEPSLGETLLVAGPELLSRYEFAQRLAKTFGLPEANIRSTSFDSTLQAAFTPKRLRLDTSKAARILRTPMRGVDDGLRAMVALAEEGYRERLDRFI